jgi:hypothetical protein
MSMAVPKRRSAAGSAAPSAAPKPGVRLAAEGDRASPSPALQRMDDLGARLGAFEHQEDDPAPRWSHRKTAAFIAVTCGGFWICAALGIARLLR